MNNEQYKALEKAHGTKELAESFVFPNRLTKKQREAADAELLQILKERRAEISQKDRIRGELYQLRFQIEDYLNNQAFDKGKTFGYFLKQYISRFKLKRNEFAEKIQIKPSDLSLYINNHRTPPQYITIRLEIHSNNIIPATDWFRLALKEDIHELQTDKTIRQKQRKYVSSVLA